MIQTHSYPVNIVRHLTISRDDFPVCKFVSHTQIEIIISLQYVQFTRVYEGLAVTFACYRIQL